MAEKKQSLERFCLGRPASGNRLGLTSAASFSGCAALILLPWLIYENGAGVFWCAFGLFFGIVFLWQALPYRMLRYSRKGEEIWSYPDYLSLRFGKGARILSLVAAGAFTLFCLFFSVQLMRLGQELLTAFFGTEETIWVRVIPLLVAAPVLAAGFSLVSGMGRPAAVIILTAIGLMVIAMYRNLGGSGTVRYTMMSGVPNTVSEYMNILYYNGKQITPGRGIGLFLGGFLFAGLPVSFPFFVSLRQVKKVKRARRAVFAWLLPVLVLSCFLGGFSRAYLYAEGTLEDPASFTAALFRALRKGGFVEKTAGAFYALALASAYFLLLFFILNRLMASVMFLVRWADERNGLLTGLAVSLGLLTLGQFRMPDMSWGSVFFVMYFWACTAGPVMFCSVFMRRLSAPAAAAGMLLGSLGMVLPEVLPGAVFVSSAISFFGPEGAGSELFSLILSVLGIILFTRLFPEKDEAVLKRFDEVKNRIG